MTLLEKYLAGDTENVYNEIYSLNSKAFEPDNFKQIDEVLIETFRRVQFNLKTIHKKLKHSGYQFLADTYTGTEKSFAIADINSKHLIDELDRKASPSYIPLSLKYFYKFVDNCDFTWNWEQAPDIPWEGSDPIVIPSINYLMDGLEEGVYHEEIVFSPDDLHKDNISGDCYYLDLGDSPIIDTLISGYNVKFIEYLRMTFLNCGFTSASDCDSVSFIEFCQTTKPLLLPI